MTASVQQTLHNWSQFTGAYRALIAPNLQVARHWILHALQLSVHEVAAKRHQEPVMLPPNATHKLVETVKQAGARIRFGHLDAELCLQDQATQRVVWLQPPLGLPARSEVQSAVTVFDHGDTLPAGEVFSPSLYHAGCHADVAIFGLHLSADPAQSGALLVFAGASLYRQVKAHHNAVDAHFYRLAARQLERLNTLVPQQHQALKTVGTGLHEAAGLPVLRQYALGALAHGVAVRVPQECSATAFWHYAQGENTPVLWMPQLCPIHYAAAALGPASAAHLERWMVVPVCPQNDSEANKQTVLGIVKAAEYLGVRWRIDPARAARYAVLLEEKYGPDHDAYRPAFAFDDPSQQQSSRLDDIGAQDLLAPACRIPDY